MYYVIKVTFSNIQMQFGPSTHKWIGLITPLDVLIGVRACIGEGLLLDVLMYMMMVG